MRQNTLIFTLVSLAVIIFGFSANGFASGDKPTDYVDEQYFDAAYYDETNDQWLYFYLLDDSVDNNPADVVLYDPIYEIYGAESGSYGGNIVLPEQFEYNGRSFITKMIAAFQYSSVGSIVIPGSVVNTCGSFYNCRSLTKVKLSENIKELELIGFNECENLEEIEFPEGIDSFRFAFYNSPLKI